MGSTAVEPGGKDRDDLQDVFALSSQIVTALVKKYAFASGLGISGQKRVFCRVL